jgi:DNA-directed RNA polymerase subunit omega
MLPSPDILNEYSYGKFVLSNLAAKRAKQLREGAPALVQIDSNHPLTIALAEIAAGKIKPIMPSAAEALVEIEEGPALLVDETMPAEFGMLLPALDETEVALVQSVVLEEDHEHEPELEDALSLSDLVDEEEVAAVASDDDTLSLSDIAEAETAEEEEVEEE